MRFFFKYRKLSESRIFILLRQVERVEEQKIDHASEKTRNFE